MISQTNPAGRRAPERQGLTELYEHVRDATERLCAPLSPEDAAAQSMPDASPAKWHLAHTTWFFETFVLEPAFSGYSAFHPAYRILFNSYYNSVGEQHPRPRRGLLTRPGLEEVLAYRRHVDAHLTELLGKPGAVDDRLAPVIEVGLHHEQQHQELILTDVKHLLAQNPLHPAYCELDPAVARGDASPLRWHAAPGGEIAIGSEASGFAFDNERPRHRVLLQPFELASRLVTNGEYREFIADQGYQRPELWLSDGWATVEDRGWRAPLYWERRDDGWEIQTLTGSRRLDLSEPVCHVSYYEADAYARWAGARLPSEAEWESVAAQVPIAGNFVEERHFHPVATSDRAPGPRQLFGDVWEWTASAYGPYPGYRAPVGALGEYNGKFMCNQLVLRGGSCATPRSHVRASYRNFFYPDARWQFSGIRLARDAD